MLELILAVAIMAIVLVAINAVFFSAVRLRERTVAAVDQSLPLEQALTIMRRDLEGAMPPSTDGILSGDFRAGAVSTLGLSMPVDLELYTTTGALRADQPWGEIQKVTYELRQPADRSQAGRDLIRSVTRNLLSVMTPQPQDEWMVGGVESIEFSCFDGSQWRTDWDTTSTDTNLPTAVRVRLQLVGADRSQPVEMVVPVDAQSRTNQTAL